MYVFYNSAQPTGSVGNAELYYDSESAALVTPYPGAVINVYEVPAMPLGSYNYGVGDPEAIGQKVPHGASPGISIEHINSVVGVFQVTEFVAKSFAFNEETQTQYEQVEEDPCVPTGSQTAMHFTNSPKTNGGIPPVPFTNTQSGQSTILGPGRIHQIVPQLPEITVTIDGTVKEYVTTTGAASLTEAGVWTFYLSKKPRQV
jgi:hypothetical protein